MNQYNQLVRDEYFRAQRVLYLSEQVAKKRQVQNLGNLNRAIRELKSNMKNLEYVMEKYSIVQAKEVQTHQEVELEKKLNTHKQEIAKSQVEESVNASTQSRSNQLTAQNTALIYESQVGMHNSHLEILKNTATTNRLMAEKMERERIKEMGLRRSYGMRISNE
jgi:Sec-independent protein translocase protein TatA